MLQNTHITIITCQLSIENPSKRRIKSSCDIQRLPFPGNPLQERQRDILGCPGLSQVVGLAQPGLIIIRDSNERDSIDRDAILY